MESILGVLAVFLLVATNGFFVAAEFSLVGARRTRITQLAEEGNAAAKTAQKAIDHLDSYIAATQLGITLASLALGWIGEPAVAHLIEPLIHLLPLPEESAETITKTVGVVIAFSFVTVLHIVAGELVPKSIALQRPESTSLVVARPVTWFLTLFRPIIRLMNGIGNWMVSVLGFEPAAGEHRVHSAEELEMLVHSSREAGLLQESEETLLRRVFDFSDITVEEIMRPRVDVDAIADDIKLAELLKIVVSNHHSRYPVYHDSIDNVVGLLLTKDLLDLVVTKPELLTKQDTFNLKPLLREPVFIPGTVGVDKLLEQMQENKTHLAVVIDEYGGMAGVATMEDVIEQLVGEVQDEYDDEPETASISLQGNETLVDGMVSLNEVIERFGDPGGTPESTTIGGYVAERLNRIPTVGDTVIFADYDLSVDDMEGMRVARVRFTRRPEPPPAEPASTSQNGTPSET